jgi:hypothetical protein
MNLTSFRRFKFSYPNLVLKIVYQGNYFSLMTCIVKSDHYSQLYLYLLCISKGMNILNPTVDG